MPPPTLSMVTGSVKETNTRGSKDWSVTIDFMIQKTSSKGTKEIKAICCQQTQGLKWIGINEHATDANICFSFNILQTLQFLQYLKSVLINTIKNYVIQYK